MNDISLYEKIPASEKNFPIRINTPKPMKSLIPHWHEQIEMLFFISGSCDFVCGNKTYNVNVGDMIFINNNDLHFFECDKNVEYYCILINPDFFSDVSFENVLIESFIKQDKNIKSYFEKIFSEYESKNIGWDMCIKGIMYEMMSYLFRNYKNVALPQREYDARASKLKRLNSILIYISEHYQEKLSTAELAKRYFVSECYFCRFFKKELGVSVVKYINSIRIDKAAVLLENTAEDITDIATNVGFDDVNYFSRIFKKYKQISPSEYRNHLLNN